MKHLVLVFIICSAINLVCLQDVTESSGDSLTSVSTSLTTDWLHSEAVSSGEGPVISTILDNVDLMDESNNDTDFIDSSVLKNGELLNETSVTSLSSTLPWTTSETTSLSTTISSLQTTPEPSTTTTTTTSPTTTTTTITTTTLPPPTTTTMKTTTPPPTTTTVVRTTRPTTRRPTTIMSTTTKKATKIPPPVTVPNTKPSPQIEAPCEFMEEDFVCDTEISCFGEGTIDCVITEELVHDAPESKSSAAPLGETDDYEEESATIGFFPPELVGRVPPRFSFPWHIKPENSAISEVSSEPTTTVETSPESSTFMTSTTNTEKGESTLLVTSSVPSTAQPNTMNTFPSTRLLQNATHIFLPIDSITEILGESSTFSVNNVTESNSTDTIHIENGTSEGLATSSETAIGHTESDINSTTESQHVQSASTIGNRRKRDSNRKDSSSSSESLKLTVDDSKERVNSCKVTGNLHCTPAPTKASCRGRGTCKVISVEKTEKSTSSKGVENWAIAVIAICATAAVLTIGLLVYLVVTSWKKLKVQPQNGVTTLNYVNSSPP